jgi:histidine ammonia-lyase
VLFLCSRLALLPANAFLCGTALHVQVKAFEADVVECLGYKGAISAADELKGLLDGSKAAGSRKGLAAEQQALFSNLPLVGGLTSLATKPYYLMKAYYLGY